MFCYFQLMYWCKYSPCSYSIRWRTESTNYKY